MTSTSSLDDALVQVVENRRLRLERLLQIAAHDYELRLEFGQRDELGEATIVLGMEPHRIADASTLALKGQALHLLGHFLSEGLIWAEAARRQEAEGLPNFAGLWHALEDARLENWLVSRWPGAGRAFDSRLPPNLGGSSFRLLPPAYQVEMGLYLVGRGHHGAHYATSVAEALTSVAEAIEQGASGDSPRASLEAMEVIYPGIATMLGVEHMHSALSPSASVDRVELRLETIERDSLPGEGDDAPEIEVYDGEVGIMGRNTEFPNRYRPGTLPWFERGLGQKEIHPSAVRTDRETIVEPPEGDDEAYRLLRAEVRHEVGYLARRLTNLLREETYLRYGGRYRSGKLNMAKLWKQRLGAYRLFQRPLERGKRGEAFTLLVDESASMKGQDKITTATKAALLLGETLDQLGVPLEIIGFSTAEFEAKAAMQLGLIPAHEHSTTRCSSLEHRLYKRFDEPYRVVHSRLTGIQPRHNNWDEEHLLFAFRRIQARAERRKVIIVISDGQPNGDADYLIETVARLERLGCKIVGVGIGADFVQQVYRDAIVVSNFRQLADELFQILVSELRGRPTAYAGRLPTRSTGTGVSRWSV